MKIYQPILGISLLIHTCGLANCELKSQYDFEKICLSGGHSYTSCNCIYKRLEHIYSPQLLMRLKYLSLQHPELPKDFVSVMFSTIQWCDENEVE